MAAIQNPLSPPYTTTHTMRKKMADFVTMLTIITVMVLIVITRTAMAVMRNNVAYLSEGVPIEPKTNERVDQMGVSLTDSNM